MNTLLNPQALLIISRSAAPSQLHNPLTVSASLKRKSCSNAYDNDSDTENKPQTSSNFSYTANASAWKKLSENCQKKKNKKHDNYDASEFKSVFRKPLESKQQLAITGPASSSAGGGVWDAISMSQKAHEEFMRKLINPAFKIPLPNYVSTSSRSLGIKRQGTRQPLYDLDAENALILYAPPVLSATELLNVDK